MITRTTTLNGIVVREYHQIAMVQRVGGAAGAGGYGLLLAGHRSAAGLSQRALAERAHMDHASIVRSESGQRPPAGADEVVGLAAVLGLSPGARDELLISAGFWPAAVTALGPGDETLRAVAEALAGPDDPARARLRTTLQAVVAAATAPRPAAPSAVPVGAAASTAETLRAIEAALDGQDAVAGLVARLALLAVAQLATEVPVAVVAASPPMPLRRERRRAAR